MRASKISINTEHFNKTEEILLCRDVNKIKNGELVAKIYGDYSFALKAAAAPEMLEALERINAKYAHLKESNSVEWLMVQNAIEKAKGA